MCEACYLDYGAPVKITPAVLDILDDLAAADEFGGLHIIVDDWNLEDEHVEYCMTCEEASEEEKVLATRLRALDLPERATALALVDGYLSRP